MSKHLNETDLIEQYLVGSLDKENKRLIEERIAKDENFAEDIEQHKLLIDGLKYSERKKLYSKLKKWDMELSDDIEVESKHTIGQPTNWYYAIASIIFFSAVSFLIYSNFYSGYDRLVADNYKPYTYIPEVKRGDKIEKNSIEHIFRYYDRGDYNQTIQLINKLEDDQKTEQVNFIMANTYQANKNYFDAIKLYERILNSGSIYVSGSKWYLALCYLSTNNVEQAIPLLEELKGSSTSYSLKAENILKDLQAINIQ